MKIQGCPSKPEHAQMKNKAVETHKAKANPSDIKHPMLNTKQTKAQAKVYKRKPKTNTNRPDHPLAKTHIATEPKANQNKEKQTKNQQAEKTNPNQKPKVNPNKLKHTQAKTTKQTEATTSKPKADPNTTCTKQSKPKTKQKQAKANPSKLKHPSAKHEQAQT